MPLIIETTDPHGLLQEIKDKIDAGDIKTWSYQDDQFDYLAAQYANEAVLNATVTATEVKLALAWNKGATRPTRSWRSTLGDSPRKSCLISIKRRSPGYASPRSGEAFPWMFGPLLRT